MFPLMFIELSRSASKLLLLLITTKVLEARRAALIVERLPLLSLIVRIVAVELIESLFRASSS